MDPESSLPPPWIEPFFSKVKQEACAELHAKVVFTVRIMLDEFREDMKRLIQPVHSNDRAGDRLLDTNSCNKDDSMKPSDGQSSSISGRDPCENCQQLASERDRIEAELKILNRQFNSSEHLVSSFQLMAQRSQFEINYYKNKMEKSEEPAATQKETQSKLENALERIKFLEQENLKLSNDVQDGQRTREELREFRAEFNELKTRFESLSKCNRLEHVDPLPESIDKVNLEFGIPDVSSSAACNPTSSSSPPSEQEDLKIEVTVADAPKDSDLAPSCCSTVEEETSQRASPTSTGTSAAIVVPSSTVPDISFDGKFDQAFPSVNVSTEQEVNEFEAIIKNHQGQNDHENCAACRYVHNHVPEIPSILKGFREPHGHTKKIKAECLLSIVHFVLLKSIDGYCLELKDLCRKSLEWSPLICKAKSDPNVLTLLAQVSVDDGQYSNALYFINKVLRCDPSGVSQARYDLCKHIAGETRDKKLKLEVLKYELKETKSTDDKFNVYLEKDRSNKI